MIKRLIICSDASFGINAADDGAMVFAQTFEHPFMEAVRAAAADSMDDIYRCADDFDALNSKIAHRLLAAPADTVLYVTLGCIGAGTLAAIKSDPLFEGVRLKVLPALGFAQRAAAAAAERGLLSDIENMTICPANALVSADPTVTLAVTEISTPLAAGEVKLTLSEYYSDECDILFALPNIDGYTVERLKLFELDRQPAYDAAAVVILPPRAEDALTRHDTEGLMRIMRRLRAPGGCPWDAEQTHESLKTNLIEEAYEVIDAIDRADEDAMCEELGDLLLQIAFHAVIEEERDGFSMRDVSTGIVNKLIYRHPHIFADVTVNNSDEVLQNWEKLKQKEKHQSTVADAMHAVPRAFPALMRAYKVQKKAAHVGFDWDGAALALDKVYEEAGEVREAVAEGVRAHIEDEVGDLFFAAVNVARLLKIDPELALSAATDKFEKRFELMERQILLEGKKPEDMTLAEMDVFWERVKKELS